MALSFLQYCYKNSIIHKISPLIKLLVLCFISIFIFICPSKIQILSISIFFIFTIIVFFMSKLPLKSLNFVFVIISFSFFIVFFKIINFFPLSLDFTQIKSSLIYVCNMFICITLSNIFFMTTANFELLSKLNKIPILKKFNIGILLCIIIHFIPMCVSTINKVILTIKVRNQKKGLFTFIKNIGLGFCSVFSKMLKNAYYTNLSITNRLGD